MSDSPVLPPKTEVCLALLQSSNSVYVHLDPRAAEVQVPVAFRSQAQLVLQVGLNMAVPIPDLDVGQDALSCTLSFNRRAEFCYLPWGAIYGIVGEDGRGMIWPDSVPPEVASAAEGRAMAMPKEKKPPSLRLAAQDGVALEEVADDSKREDSPSTEADSSQALQLSGPGADSQEASAETSAEKPEVDGVAASAEDGGPAHSSLERIDGEAPQGSVESVRSATADGDIARRDAETSATQSAEPKKKERPAYLRLVK
ncbi:MAG: ClpXP protease specificity-enhancing factor SspB [Polyangiaceae bacterium]|nr:ClpXP protease specificity-enhancing factor SspB [Polyangiaceae bacterium]